MTIFDELPHSEFIVTILNKLIFCAWYGWWRAFL